MLVNALASGALMVTPPPRPIEQLCSAPGVKINFACVAGVLRDDKQLPAGTPNAS